MRVVRATYQAPDDKQSVTRRFETNLDVASDYQRLVSKLTQLFPELGASNFTIHIPESGGDTVVAATEDDIFVALGSMPPGGTLNIVIEEKKRSGCSTSSPAIVCDSCGASIYGHRYKCTVCTNFYLCVTCEQRGRHSHHPVMRTTTDAPTKPSSQRTRLWDMGCHRHSPLFEDCGSTQRTARPFGSGFFHCLNPSAFEEFHQMAADLTRAWCGSMPPPKSNPNSSNVQSSQAGSGTTSTQPMNTAKCTGTHQEDAGYHGYTKSEQFDQGLFTQMVDEMTEKMNSTMDSIGAKHKASNGQTGEDIGRHHHSENSPSDFVQMTEMLSPMMKNMIGAVGGDCNTQQDVRGQNGYQDNQNKETVIIKKEVEQTSPPHVNPDTKSTPHVTPRLKSSPCTNNKDPYVALDSKVPTKKQSTQPAKRNPDSKLGSDEASRIESNLSSNIRAPDVELDSKVSSKNPDPELISTVPSKRMSGPCANKDTDPQFASTLPSTRQSGPCANKDPNPHLASTVASKRQSIPCAINKDPPTTKAGNKGQSTASTAKSINSIPSTKDNALPDPPQYATIQRGLKLYPKMDLTNSNNKSKEYLVKSPMSTGIPQFNTRGKQDINSNSVNDEQYYPSLFNKTQSVSQTTNSSHSRRNSTSEISLPNLKTEVQSSSFKQTGQAGSDTSNKEQSSTSDTNKELSTLSDTNTEHSTPSDTNTNTELSTPSDTNTNTELSTSSDTNTNTELSTPSDNNTNAELSTPSDTSTNAELPCDTNNILITPCDTKKALSTQSETKKLLSTPDDIKEVLSTPCDTNTELPTRCDSNKVLSSPCNIIKGRSSQCNSTGTPFNHEDSAEEGSSQGCERKELSDIKACKCGQPSASRDKARHEDIFITSNIQPQLSVFRAKEGTPDITDCNHTYGISNKGCGTTLMQDEVMSGHPSDGTESNKKSTGNSIQSTSVDLHPGHVITKPHTCLVEKEHCQEPVNNANSKQSCSGNAKHRPSNIPQLAARKSLSSPSDVSDSGYKSAHSTHIRRPYFDPRGGSAANKAFTRVRKPPTGDTKRGKTCYCSNPFNTKLIHRLTSPCYEPKPGTSSMPDTASTPGTDDDKKTEDEKLTNALDSLETMGFADVGGSLTELLKEEDYDVWRVLERVLTY